MADPLIIEGNYITVPVGPAVERAILAWARDNLAALDTALGPFGLKATDIVLPEWHRLVYVHELTESTEQEQKR